MAHLFDPCYKCNTHVVHNCLAHVVRPPMLAPDVRSVTYIWHISKKKNSACIIRGRRLEHGDTSDQSPVLFMAFRRDRPPYTQEILQIAARR